MARALAAHRAGDQAETARICRRLLRKQGQDGQALTLLAHALLKAGQLDDAAAVTERLNRAAPDDAGGWNLKGRLLLFKGRAEDAEAAQLQAVACAPRHPMAWHQLGLARKMAGNLDGAVAALREAHQLAPDDPTLRYNYCLALIETGQPDAAERLARDGLALTADSVQLQHALGMSLLTQDRQHEAVRVLRAALARQPDHPGLRTDYGSALAAIGDQRRGIEQLRAVLERDPGALVARDSLVKALRGIGQIDEALAELAQLAALPGYRGSEPLQRAGLLATLGRDDESAALIEPFLDQPDHALDATAILASVAKKTGRVDEAIARIERLQAAADYDRADEKGRDALIKLDFLLGDLHDARGDYHAAFAAYARGNQRRRVPYDHAAARTLVDRVIAGYDRAAFARLPRAGNHDTTPIFIVGMPRSGTSLLEQMLDSHPGVHGAGELSAVGNLVEALALETGTPFPELIGELDAGQLDRLAGEHLDYLARLSSGAARVTDKMPGNYLNLGFIAQLFPAARIIHCRRQAEDTALSIYFQNFTSYRGHPYANDLADIGFAYRQYQRLMAHWADALPLPLHTVDYEAVVADPEDATRELCTFLDLDWNPAMLRFHESRRVVVTASRQQVREKLYGTSVNRWERYRGFLAPLQAELAKAPNAA